MSNYTINYRFNLSDNLTRPMRNMARKAKDATRNLRGAGNAANTAGRNLRNMSSAAGNSGKNLRKLGHDATFAERRLHRLARRMRNMQTIRLGMGGALTGLGAGLVTRRIGSTLIEYEKKMNFVLSKMTDSVVKVGGQEKFILKGITDGSLEERIDASAKALAMLREETKRISRVSIFDPTQVAGGLLQLAQAGLSPEKAMQVLHPAIRLAAVGGISPEAAADFATNTANMFGLGLDRTSEVVDIFATAVTNTNFDLPDLKESLKYAGASSFSAGQDLKGITASLMALAQVGEKGSTAGNSLARIFESLYKSSGPATKALKKIGLTQDSFLNKEGKAIPLAEMMKILSEKVDTHGFKEVQRAIHALFQARGGRGAKHLINLLEVIAEKRAWLEKSHKRAAMMEKLMMSGVYGAYEKMRSSIYEAIIALGDGGLSADIEYLADKVRGLANSFSQLNPSTKKWIGRMLLLATAISAVVIPLGIFIWAMGALIPFFALLVSPVGLVTAGVLALGAALTAVFSKYWDGSELQSLFRALGEQVDTVASSILNFSVSDNPIANVFRTALDYATKLVGIVAKIPSYIMNPSKALKDFAKFNHDTAQGVGDRAASFAKKVGSWLPDLSVSKSPKEVITGKTIAKSQADKEIALRVQTENKVKLDAPNSVMLKLPNGGVAGTIPLKSSVVSRGVTTPDAVGP